MCRAAADIVPGERPPDDLAYVHVRKIVADRVAAIEGYLLVANVSKGRLWKAFLDGLPESVRQHYNCRNCRRFIENFGGIISQNGSPLWSPEGVPDLFRASFSKLRSLVEGARIGGVFVTSESEWGKAETDEWTHLHGKYREPWVSKVLTDSQRAAEKTQEHHMLRRALARYPAEVAAEALRVLKAKVLTGSETAVHIAEWFHDLHGKSAKEVWFAAASAPVGWCHINSTMISTLLDDIINGLSFEQVKRRWVKKMDPLRHRRPQVPPKAGNIDRAEKLIEKLGIARSLERRFATLDDVTDKLWSPAGPSEGPEEDTASGGVFGHLRSSPKANQLQLPARNITWEKFLAEVLPEAITLEGLTENHGSYYGLVAPVHPDAPPILWWESQVSWYFYPRMDHPNHWGMRVGEWVPVTAVFLSPWAWGDRDRSCSYPNRAFFALEGQKDARNDSLMLFPAMIRSELHEVRSVIEAHSKSGKLSGEEGSNASGIYLTDRPGEPAISVRVNGQDVYRIDRWS